MYHHALSDRKTKTQRKTIIFYGLPECQFLLLFILFFLTFSSFHLLCPIFILPGNISLLLNTSNENLRSQNRQFKIQSAKLPQDIQIAYDKMTIPIIVSNRLFRHAPPFAIRMRRAFFISLQFLCGRNLKLVCGKQRVNDRVQIFLHCPFTLRIKAAIRRINKVNRQRQPKLISE